MAVVVFGLFIFGTSVIIVLISLALVFSPKAQNKWLHRRVKAYRKFIDESKDDLTAINKTQAEISQESVEMTVRAIKKGLTDESDTYCKYCGKKIDSDSIFCKSCGKEQ